MKLKKLITMFMAAAFLLNGSAYTGTTFAATAGTDKNTVVSTQNIANDDKKDMGITLIGTEAEPVVGAPVQKMWTFQVNKSGTYKLVFTYSRSWEKDASAAKTVEYQIKVTKKNGSKLDAAALKEGKVTTVKKNQKFFLTLEENASTGYAWSYQADKKAMKLVKEETVKDSVGAPTQNMWTFQANKSGTYKLVFTCSRSWEKDTADKKTVEYTVKVTDESTTDTSAVGLIEGKENTLKTGQKFMVSLEENTSTGYSWSYEIMK